MVVQRAVAYGSMAGVALGGFTWVVVAGRLIHDPIVTIAGYVTGLAVWLVGATLVVRYPARRMAVVGTVVLFVVLVDWGVLAVVLPLLPEQGGSIYFGTSRSAYTLLQPTLLVLGAGATGLVLWDLFRRR